MSARKKMFTHFCVGHVEGTSSPNGTLATTFPKSPEILLGKMRSSFPCLAWNTPET